MDQRRKPRRTRKLPEPEILAAEIIENLEDALEQFKAIQETLEEE
jgi:hypothetical protein